MIKLKSKNILGLLGSLTFVSNSLAHEVKIHFDHQGSFYTSPVIYLTGIGGQNPKIAMNNGIPTTGGVDAKEENFSKFNFVSFQTDPIIDITDLKIIPISSEENLFCKQLKLSLYSSSEGNKILLPSTFFGLTTSTTCHFKIVSLNNTQNEISDNKITFIFNYTLLGWLSDLGNGTKAQNTAEIIRDLYIDPNSTEIRIMKPHNKVLTDISPLMGFIKAEVLDLSSNQIKVIPDAIGYLTKLKSLYLSRNQIEAIPDTIGNLTKLKSLFLHYNKIKVIPETIGNLTNLKNLFLPNNQIEFIPATIGNLSNLQRLYLANNQIKVIPDTIGNLTNLKRLYLPNNQIEVIPESIGNLNLLLRLYLHDNQIKIIPESIGNLSNLQRLYLPNNQIEVIPESIGNLSYLKRLYLYDNQIRIIPETIGNLTNLKKLCLSL